MYRKSYWWCTVCNAAHPNIEQCPQSPLVSVDWTRSFGTSEAPQPGKVKGHGSRVDCKLCRNKGWVLRFAGNFWDEDDCYMEREACECQVVEVSEELMFDLAEGPDEYEKDCPECGQLLDVAPSGWYCITSKHKSVTPYPRAVMACAMDGLGWCQECYDELED